MKKEKIILQVALDFIDLSRAIKAAEEAVRGGVDYIEAGTPLIKSAGLDAVRELRARFPKNVIVADMKIMDCGRVEVEAAAKAGAGIVTVLAASSDSTIRECVEAGKQYGVKISADLIDVKNPGKRAVEAEKLGVDIVGMHISIDNQMKGKMDLSEVKSIVSKTGISVSVAGGINSENAAECAALGAKIIIVGGAIIKSVDAEKAARDIRKALDKGIKVSSGLFRRVNESGIRQVFMKVSTANISDAMHRAGCVRGVYPLFSGIKMAGPAFTVRTSPGDWAKPVEAIDRAKPGDVIVVDAGGVSPAVWGELATTSAIQKKITGLLLYGAVRDTADIKKLKFPVFSAMAVPNAGEPKGFGEIDIPVNIGGILIRPGDWIIGDDDGVIAVREDRAAEAANRAMDVLEKENRLRKEIREGSSLAAVAELLKWEKK